MSVLGPMLLAQSLAAFAGIEPPAPPQDVEITPSETVYVEARYGETVIRSRPWVPRKRIATVAKGTRLVVRGQVESRDDKGCSGKPWYAVWPFGFVCSKHVRASELPPETEPTLPVPEGRRLPHAYAMVRADDTPSYASVEDAELEQPDGTFAKGMSLVVARSVDIGERRFVQTSTGKLVPREGVGFMGQGSAWGGVDIEADRVGPLFAWVRKKKTPVRAAPDRSAEVVRTVDLRERVPLLEPESESVRPLWWRVGDGEWIEADSLNEVHITEPPKGVLSEFREKTTGSTQWFDVDVGEQVLIAYRGSSPQFATLISSGRGSPTPLGNYPVWAKVASMDMGNQEYEDKPYLVQGVPWVLLFQGHNALHGAYWHDRFGNRKSHGCVNLAPQDARWAFEWATVMMPKGWTGYLPSDLDRSPVVHVRDSSRPHGATFTQQRPVGPPDLEAERLKTEAAERRRAAEAEAQGWVEQGAEAVVPPEDAVVPRIEAPPL